MKYICFYRIHAILRGYLIAFDYHWNLLMRDVDEEYIPLKSKHKFPQVCLIIFIIYYSYLFIGTVS